MMKTRQFTGLLFLFLFLHWGCESHKHYSSYTGTNTKISATTEDAKAQQMIAPYKAQLDLQMNKVIGISSQEMIKAQPESLLGNFVADLVLDMGRKTTGQPVDFCLLNTGGLRTALPKGAITVGRIFELMPFENALVILELEATQIKTLLSYLANTGGHPIAGLRMEIQENADGSKTAANVFIQGDKWEETKRYTVITSDYLANGGDNMTFFSNPVSTFETQVKLRDAIIQHIETLTSEGKEITVKMDGRIRVKDHTTGE